MRSPACVSCAREHQEEASMANVRSKERRKRSGGAMRETRKGSKKSPRVFVHLFARLKNENIFSSKITVVRNKRFIFALDKTQPFPFPVALRRTHSVKFRGLLPDGSAQTIFDLIDTITPTAKTEYPPGTCAFR